MSDHARIISEPLEVDTHLHALGLERSGLREVLEAARWGRANYTEYDPPGYAGWNQYGLGTRFLRMLLIEDRDDDRRWSMSNVGNLCRTISPDGSMAIVVSSGSHGTGDPAREPTTRNPKGRYSLAGMRVNTSQMDLFGEPEAAALPWLWFLLVEVRKGEVFGELSLPLDVDKDGRASEWLQRIMLAPWSPQDDPSDRGLDEDFEINVTRRTG